MKVYVGEEEMKAERIGGRDVEGQEVGRRERQDSRGTGK
jgi:hypothetical protein